MTKELREMLCNLCRCTPHNKAFVDSILRLDEEVASEDGQCTGHEATIGRLSEDLRAARAARADLFSALSRVEASRDEARTMLGQLQSAFSAAVNVVIKTGHHRTTPVLAEAVSLIVAERDEARSVRANQEATIVDLGEALASAIDERDEAKADLDALARAVAQALMVPTLNDREELVDPIDHAIVGAMLGMRNARDTALARLAKVEAERDGARAKLAEVERTVIVDPVRPARPRSRLEVELAGAIERGDHRKRE